MLEGHALGERVSGLELRHDGDVWVMGEVKGAVVGVWWWDGVSMLERRRYLEASRRGRRAPFRVLTASEAGRGPHTAA